MTTSSYTFDKMTNELWVREIRSNFRFFNHTGAKFQPLLLLGTNFSSTNFPAPISFVMKVLTGKGENRDPNPQ